MPADYAAALEGGLAELGLTLPASARQAIDDHVRLLLAWNAAINLTAIREPTQIAIRHVIDSLAAVATFRRLRIGRFVDLGSGGGFPGLTLAAALPTTSALLVESVGKKAAFLATVVAASGLDDRVGVAAERGEEVARDPNHRETWPAVTARAVGALAELVELSFPLLAPGGSLIAWKTADLADEMAPARRAIAALGGGRIDGIEGATSPLRGLEGHRLVVVTKRGRTPVRFPRDQGARKRHPW